ncbi:MAG: phosphate/phosphite/phosphonate ABC transporter substrate-binding protein [Chloroflexi bacterium]|nr:phosphate/phosphite/phosphonate ABC transporter substrate-binding protein [Chloroflexota bacterium]
MNPSIRVIAAVLLALVLAACAGPPRLRVRLASPAGPAAGLAAEAQARAPAVPLRIAVAGVVSPKETFRSYQELIASIGRRSGRPAELIQRPTYGEINALVRSGQADLAFVCTLAYVEGQREFGMELLAAPVVRGRAEYSSYVIVPSGSPARSLEDLRGTAFAFSDPLSNTGRYAPTYELLRSGQSPETFFRRVIYTYSHDNSIRAVADRLVDGAAVDSLVYESAVERKPELGQRLRVIARIGPYPTPPVVVNPALPPDQKAALRAILLGLHEDPEGQRILAELGIDRFVPLDDRAYDSVRTVRDAVQKAEQVRQ